MSSTPPRRPVPIERVENLLAKLPIFNGLGSEELRELIGVCRTVRAVAGCALFEEGEASNAMYVLLSGVVEIRTQGAGKLHTVVPGEVFGEIGMITQRRRTATALPVQDVDLLEIPRESFNKLLGQSPRISALVLQNVTQTLANHLVRMNQRLSTEYLPPAEDG